MVFSVIGDSHSFVPRPWPRTVFQTALIEAAKSGGGNHKPLAIKDFFKCGVVMEFMKRDRKRKITTLICGVAYNEITLIMK